jgi:hypothetical protein
MQLGAIVRYNPDYSEPSERDLLFVILEYYDNTDRYLIECLNGKTRIKCQELVAAEMIELAD